MLKILDVSNFTLWVKDATNNFPVDLFAKANKSAHFIDAPASLFRRCRQ